MATLQCRNKSYRVLFLYHGKRHTFTIGEVSQREAENWSAQVDQTLLRIGQNLLRVPEAVDIVDFVRNGGRPEQVVSGKRALEAVSLGQLRERYLDTHRNGAMEANTLATVEMHLRHVERTLGSGFPIGKLTLADLQRHLDRRAKKKYRGKSLSPVTLKKEISTLRATWNWASLMRLVEGTFPSKGLVYAKQNEKPPLQTWKEIERKLPGLSTAEQQELWDCLFLVKAEVSELLEFVKMTASHPWIYPAICFAAHTGARRSEVIRVRLGDLDLDAGTVLIHEKKRAKGKRTTRRVPLSPPLQKVLNDWLKIHPGGQHLFCNGAEVFRSKKRSKWTGYHGEKTRATTGKGRMAGVTVREAPALGPLTRDEAHDHFQRTLAGSKWSVIRGWHCLRHSFISNCAAAGVDQRLIDAWVGHTTEEMRRRYRHLIPSTEQEAIRSVFGG